MTANFTSWETSHESVYKLLFCFVAVVLAFVLITIIKAYFIKAGYACGMTARNKCLKQAFVIE